MNYYFGKFEDAGQSQIGDTGVSERQRLLSELATGLDSYEAREEVSETCDTLASDVSSDWEDQALSEITTSGYRPNRKHGVGSTFGRSPKRKSSEDGGRRRSLTMPATKTLPSALTTPSRVPSTRRPTTIQSSSGGTTVATSEISSNTRAHN